MKYYQNIQFFIQFDFSTKEITLSSSQEVKKIKPKCELHRMVGLNQSQQMKPYCCSRKHIKAYC